MRYFLALILIMTMAVPAYAQSLSKGAVQRHNYDFLTLDGTDITSTGAELNILDGVTATATELNQSSDISANSEIGTGANTLTTAECGETVILSTTGHAQTLPAPTQGCEFDFIVGTEAQSFTVVTTGAETIKGLGFESETDTGDDGPTTAGADTITFVSGTAKSGNRVNLYSDGTSWFGLGLTAADGAITYTSAI